MTAHRRIVSGSPYEQGASTILPTWLSDNHVKRFRYSQDAYVQEAVAELDHQGQLRPETLRGYSFLLLKPDCHPTRSAKRIVDAVHELGFTTHHAELVSLTRHSLREMWRFELNRSLPARYALWDLAFLVHPLLLVVLRAKHPDVEASFTLWNMKGQLRSLAGAQKGILNRVHLPDSLIDCLRELSILIPADRLGQMMAGPPQPIGNLVDALMREAMQPHPERSLELGAVFEAHAGLRGFVDDQAEQIARRPLELKAEMTRRFKLDHWDLVILFNEFAHVVDPRIPRAMDFETDELYEPPLVAPFGK